MIVIDLSTNRRTPTWQTLQWGPYDGRSALDRNSSDTEGPSQMLSWRSTSSCLHICSSLHQEDTERTPEDKRHSEDCMREKRTEIKCRKWGEEKKTEKKTHLHWCVLALYTQYFLKFGDKKHRHINQSGFKPKSFAILRAVFYQLGLQDCLVARGSSNPLGLKKVMSIQC